MSQISNVLPVPYLSGWLLKNKQYRFYLRKMLRDSLLPKKEVPIRARSFVQAEYEKTWAKDLANLTNEYDSYQTIYQYRGRYIRSNYWLLRLVYVDFVAQGIRKFGARKVLEVGFGRGENMVLLALMFPELELEGIELTEHGAHFASQLVKNIPQSFVRAANATEAVVKTVSERIRLTRGSATELPFATKKFDLSFTTLAIEQMAHDYKKVAREMSRVTNRCSIFVEPFAEANKNYLLGRMYLEANDYFRFSHKNIEECGFKYASFTADFPQKLHFKAGAFAAIPT